MAAKFHFRLQRVLDYRELAETWAQDAYLEAQRRRLAADAELADIHNRRVKVLRYPALGVADRLALERTLFAIDDMEHQQRLAIQVLMNEEASALATWRDKRRDAEALRKVREAAYKEWELEESRREQAELDEWSVLRRAS